MMERDGPTAPLAEFWSAYRKDDNLWWMIGCGHHQNLLDAAVEEIEKLSGKDYGEPSQA